MYNTGTGLVIGWFDWFLGSYMNEDKTGLYYEEVPRHKMMMKSKQIYAIIRHK